MMTDIQLFMFFNVILAICIAVDLFINSGTLEKKFPRIPFYFTLAWLGFAAFFNFLIFCSKGKTSALEFLSGYLIELSLSIDNLFVFIFVFSYFQIKPEHQHKILFWGIIGALIMRFIFIIAGIELITHFHWLIYLFGAFLVFGGIIMLKKKETKKQDITKNPILVFIQKKIPVCEDQETGKFFVRKNNILMATPLFIALIAIEIADLIFALDSIPAVFGVTLDPLIVYTSNACAIGGLRSLFAVVQHTITMFRFLHQGISCLLIFIGIKMVASSVYPISIIASLIVIAIIIAASILLSVIIKKPNDT